jgi:hypothetical protein
MHILSDEQYNRLMVRGESRRKSIASEKREKANRILEGEDGK